MNKGKIYLRDTDVLKQEPNVGSVNCPMTKRLSSLACGCDPERPTSPRESYSLWFPLLMSVGTVAFLLPDS